jgi:hypothetical protein
MFIPLKMVLIGIDPYPYIILVSFSKTVNPIFFLAASFHFCAPELVQGKIYRGPPNILDFKW